MRMRLLFVLAFLLAGSQAVAQSTWSRIKLDSLHETWVNQADPNVTIHDVVKLNPTFLNQTLANPHVQYEDNTGDWMVMSYGDQALSSLPYDAIYIPKRLAAYFDHWAIPSAPALQYPLSIPGYLGSGAGVTKTPTSTTAGRHFFAVVPVENPADNTGWVAWAARDENDQKWYFLGPGGTEVTDPTASLKLIKRSDFHKAWQHIAMVFVNGSFYVVVGYAGGCGIKATWWRITFNQADDWGLTHYGGGSSYEVQRWDSGAGPSFVSTDGTVPSNNDSWQCRAQDPPSNSSNGNTGPADPMDIVVVPKADGSFDSMLFIYTPEANFAQLPTRVFYAKGALPINGNLNFQWSPMQSLDTSLFWDRGSFPGYEGIYKCLRSWRRLLPLGELQRPALRLCSCVAERSISAGESGRMC